MLMEAGAERRMKETFKWERGETRVKHQDNLQGNPDLRVKIEMASTAQENTYLQMWLGTCNMAGTKRL